MCESHRINPLIIASAMGKLYHPRLWIGHLISVEKHSTHQGSVEKYCFAENYLRDLDAKRDLR